MADTFSSLLNLRFQQTGQNSNTWGELLNTDTFQPIENAIAGKVSTAITGGSTDWSSSPGYLQYQVYIFTGVLVSDHTVTIPNKSKRMLVINSTTGSFDLLMKTTSGSATCIPQGVAIDVYCDGSNALFRGDGQHIGEIAYFANTSVPAGWLECDGSAVSRTGKVNLFNRLSTTWGVGNGSTTFNLPDLKTAGRFLRSRTASVAVGTYQAETIGPHSHTATGSTSVSLSIAADGAFTPSITITDPTHAHSATTGPLATSGQATGFSGISGQIWFGNTSTGTSSFNGTGITASSTGIGNHTHAGSSASATTTVTVNNNSGTENRPINAVAIACIKY